MRHLDFVRKDGQLRHPEPANGALRRGNEERNERLRELALIRPSATLSQRERANTRV